ncbi:MAG: transposase [Microbacteriaceae bacterium]
MAFPRKYTDEVREASVNRVLERRSSEPNNRSVVREVAAEFEVGEQSLRQWIARIDDGVFDYNGRGRSGEAPVAAAGETTRLAEALAENAALREEVAALKKVLTILAADLKAAR